MRLLPASMLAASLFACSTIGSRIEERQELFDGYPPPVQQAIRAGRVAPGMTQDAVWMALGEPDRTAVEATEEGEVLVWLYTRSNPGFGVSVGGGSYGGTGVGGGVGVGRGGDSEYEAVVRFAQGVVSYVSQTAD